MAEHERRDDPRTISHNLDDALETTLGERLDAEREGDATHPSPQAPDRTEPIGDQDTPVNAGDAGGTTGGDPGLG